MVGWFSILGVCVGLAALACAANAQAPDAKAQAEKIVAKTASSAGIWAAQANGAVRHEQSGLLCAPTYANASLSAVFVFDTPAGKGADVGCDYARAENGAIVAKHTMFAVKLPDGGTLDKAFESYRNEMYSTAPKNARSGGQSMHIEGDVPRGFPEVRSEEIFYKFNGREYQSEVVVMIMKGWIIEIRSTRPSQYAVQSPDEATDSTVSALMMIDAVSAFTPAPGAPT